MEKEGGVRGNGAKEEQLSLVEGKWRKLSIDWGGDGKGTYSEALAPRLAKCPYTRLSSPFPGITGYVLLPHLSQAGQEHPELRVQERWGVRYPFHLPWNPPVISLLKVILFTIGI